MAEIIFAGKESYRPPEDFEERVKLFNELEKMFTGIFKENLEKILDRTDLGTIKPSLDIKKRGGKTPYFHIGLDTIFAGDVIRDSSWGLVKKDLEEKALEIKAVQKKIDGGLENLFHNLPREYYDKISLSGGWGGSYSNVTLRPIYGTYLCPECDTFVEEKEIYTFATEDVAYCNKNHPLVLFTDSKLNKPFYPKPKILVYEKKPIRIIKMHNRNKAGFRVYEELKIHAKQEESSFLSMDFKRFIDGLDRIYLIQKNHYPVGYCGWNNFEDDAPNSMPVLRQIFVLEGHRREGLGVALMRETVRYEVDNKQFGIESPNEKSTNLLVTLGYAQSAGDKIKGIKCKFVQGM